MGKGCGDNQDGWRGRKREKEMWEGFDAIVAVTLFGPGHVVIMAELGM